MKTAADLLKYLEKQPYDKQSIKEWTKIKKKMEREEYECHHPKVKCPKCKHEWRLRK